MVDGVGSRLLPGSSILGSNGERSERGTSAASLLHFLSQKGERAQSLICHREHQPPFSRFFIDFFGPLMASCCLFVCLCPNRLPARQWFRPAASPKPEPEPEANQDPGPEVILRRPPKGFRSAWPQELNVLAKITKPRLARARFVIQF